MQATRPRLRTGSRSSFSQRKRPLASSGVQLEPARAVPDSKDSCLSLATSRSCTFPHTVKGHGTAAMVRALVRLGHSTSQDLHAFPSAQQVAAASREQQLHIVRALQGAASVAGLLITTEAMVAEVPKKNQGAPAIPGGGMGGMDF